MGMFDSEGEDGMSVLISAKGCSPALWISLDVCLSSGSRAMSQGG